MAGGVRDQPSVFISYARRSASTFAGALHQALTRAGIPTFLDVQDLGVGERVPQGVLEGLLGASVVVVFADAIYFTRRYCAEELAAALAAYRALGQRGAGPEQLAEAVLPVVVALPAGGGQPAELERLPPEVRTTNWPPASESAQLADLVTVGLPRYGGHPRYGGVAPGGCSPDGAEDAAATAPEGVHGQLQGGGGGALPEG
jgi:hypothetical protein